VDTNAGRAQGGVADQPARHARGTADSVASLRARWTPESTAAAIRFLQGLPNEFPLPTVEHDGKLQYDLRGLRVEQTQLDNAVMKNVNLRWAAFRDVGLKDARFVKCNLSQTQFTECYFRRAAIEKCDLVNARFDGCDFSGAHIEASRLDFVTFRSCEIALDSIRFRGDTDPRVLVRVCRTLKLNEMSMGRFDDAGRLAYLEKTYDRQALFEQAFGRARAAARSRAGAAAAWLGSLLLNWLWGYGEKPLRLALFMLVNIVGFGALQYGLDALPGRALWEHVYFSGVTFLTIGFGDFAPVGMVPRFMAVLEGAAGVATFGMLIASATKKIMYR
jgi:hypothetical protein